MKPKLLAVICFSVLFCLIPRITGLAEEAGHEVFRSEEETVCEELSASIEEDSEADQPDPDTVSWFNATYAVLTEDLQGDPEVFAGFQKCDSRRKSARSYLEQKWGIHKKSDVSDKILWLLNNGDREESGDYTAAWDYGRAMQVSAWGYLAGYYTKQEALDTQLAVAHVIQQGFSSWDEYMESYLNGLLESSDEEADYRRYTDIYAGQKERLDDPYAVLWDMTLGKVW